MSASSWARRGIRPWLSPRPRAPRGQSTVGVLRPRRPHTRRQPEYNGNRCRPGLVRASCIMGRISAGFDVWAISPDSRPMFVGQRERSKWCSSQFAMQSTCGEIKCRGNHLLLAARRGHSDRSRGRYRCSWLRSSRMCIALRARGRGRLSTRAVRIRASRDGHAIQVDIVFRGRREAANRAATAAFDRIHQLNGIMSDYDPHSELSRLSDTAGRGGP